MVLQNIKFSAYPGECSPAELLYSYQCRLLKSLTVYLQKIGQSTKIDLSRQIAKLLNIDATLRFSPHLFSIYVHIKEGYEKRDLQPLLDGVQSFNILEEKEYYSLEREYNTILSEHWEKPFIEELRGSTPQDEEGAFLVQKVQIFPLIHWEIEAFRSLEFQKSEEILEDIDPSIYKEYQTYVSRIKLYSSKTLKSVTSPRFFGTIYLRVPYPNETEHLFYLETLVHELSHLHLFAMMGEDPIVLNSESELFESPLRPDKRPMMGIFHATFVLARMIRVLKKVASPTLLSHKEKCFREGLKTVLKYGRLTENGRNVFNSLEGCAFD